MLRRIRYALSASRRARNTRELAAMQAFEREHLAEFRRFHAALVDRRDVFYVFFTTNLLQWVTKTLELVPPDVNLALLGCDLSSDELDVLPRFGRPFHHIRARVDDKTIWSFLCDVSEENFGWLDVDCLVFNPDLFAEMRNIEPDVAAIGPFGVQGRSRVPLVNTFLVFVNIAAWRAVRERTPISPISYSYTGSELGRVGSYARSKIPTLKEMELLLPALPSDWTGYPVFLSPRGRFFDTLFVYQMIAWGLGYRLVRVPAGPSDVLHIGKVSYYRSWKGMKVMPRWYTELYPQLLALDYALLDEQRDTLPPQYTALHAESERELARLGLSHDRDTIARLLIEGLVLRHASPDLLACLAKSFA